MYCLLRLVNDFDGFSEKDANYLIFHALILFLWTIYILCSPVF